MLIKTVFSGFGGQGVLMMGYILAVSAMRDGMHVTYLPAYGAEVRGGTANCTVSISDEDIASPVASSPDYVIAMNKPSLIRYEGQIKPKGTLFLNSDLVDIDPKREDIMVFKIPANTIAKKLGSERGVPNMF
jgi:2-oxoglutarate ferredoxin oxidoreductase subunit gamma